MSSLPTFGREHMRAVVSSVITLSNRTNRSNWASAGICHPAVCRVLEWAQVKDLAVEVLVETAWVLARIPEQTATSAR